MKLQIQNGIIAAIQNLQNKNIQPEFRSRIGGQLQTFKFDPQRSTTANIINPENKDIEHFVLLEDKHLVTLKEFEQSIRKAGYTLMFEGCSSGASVKDFKMVTLDYYNEQSNLKDIPNHLQKRSRSIDDPRCHSAANVA